MLVSIPRLQQAPGCLMHEVSLAKSPPFVLLDFCQSLFFFFYVRGEGNTKAKMSQLHNKLRQKKSPKFQLYIPYCGSDWHVFRCLTQDSAREPCPCRPLASACCVCTLMGERPSKAVDSPQSPKCGHRSSTSGDSFKV